MQQIREATGGKGVDVSIELVGTAATMGQAVRCLGVLGRAAIVALSREALSFLPYTELINKGGSDRRLRSSRVRATVADALRAGREAHLS